MIAKPPELATLKQRPRALLLFGPDDGAVRDTARRLAAAWADAQDPLSLVTLDAADLTADPARLADEAASVSMFGGCRVIRVANATDHATEALQLLLDGPAGDPAIITAGDLKKTSKLRTLAEKHPAALAVAHYLPDARDAQRLAADRAAALGLKPTRDALARLDALSGNDRTVLAAELEKFALYLDASPEAPKPLDLEHLAALGADAAEAETDAFVAALLSARGPALDRQLALLPPNTAIPTLRAVGRALQQLIAIRAAIDAGHDAQAAVKAARPPIFWKQQEAVAERAQRWGTHRLHRALLAVLAAERAIKTPGSPGDVLAWQAMLRLAPAQPRGPRP